MADEAIKRLNERYGITVDKRKEPTKHKNKAIAIDGAKLKALCIDKMGSCKEVSRNIGYSENFINVCASNGVIQPAASMLLEHVCGINLEDYKAVEKPKAYIKQYDPEQGSIESRIDAIAKGLGEFEKIVNSNMFQIFKRLEQHGIYCEELLQLEKQNNAMMAKLLKELE